VKSQEQWGKKNTDTNKRLMGRTNRTANGQNAGMNLQDSKEATWNTKQPIHTHLTGWWTGHTCTHRTVNSPYTYSHGAVTPTHALLRQQARHGYTIMKRLLRSVQATSVHIWESKRATSMNLHDNEHLPGTPHHTQAGSQNQ